MMYDVLAERIEQIHPDLLQEIEADDLPEGQAKYYTLGSFVEVKEADRPNGEWSQYYIWMRMDHKDAQNQTKLSGSLAHEYGHFLCRTMMYPRLGRIGQYILRKLSSRPLLKVPSDFITNLIILIEELMAWVLAWGIMFELGGLKKSHLQYGFYCWKSYGNRMKKYVKANRLGTNRR